MAEATRQVTYIDFPDFQRSLYELHKRGGRYQKAAQQIQAMWSRSKIKDYGDPLHGLRLTKHGETRIRNCIKYDLEDFCRLITVQKDGFCIFLFCGSHDDADKWLERHKGFTPVVDSARRGVVTYQIAEVGGGDLVPQRDEYADGPLFERLPESEFEKIIDGLDRATTRRVERLSFLSGDADIWEAIATVVDADQRRAVFDTLCLVRAGKPAQAIARIRLFRGEVTPLEALPIQQLPELVDSMVLRRIDPRSPQYTEALGRFMRTARYKDWMSFLHPEQEEIVSEDFGGPAKLIGVSGSGKTCVVVRRAVRLAAAYPRERVLVVTINRSLAALIRELVDACAPTSDVGRIDVKAFFDVCRDALLAIDPSRVKVLDERTWKTEEHVDEVWAEFYRCENNNDDARVFEAVHDSLLARGWDPERYLREEFDWIRSALARRRRAGYALAGFKRRGRTVALSTDFKQQVLRGLDAWEAMMGTVGLVDSLGIAQELHHRLERLMPSYRCVLVDEVQDFGNVELEVLRALVPEGENDLFLCGDAAQAVTTKYQSFREAGIALPQSRARRLALNYRNSRDVLAAAYGVLYRNFTDALMDREDFEILDPEYSAFSGTTPLLLRADSLEDEIAYSLKHAREIVEEDASKKVCIAFCGFSLYELERYGREVGLSVLNGRASLEDGDIFLSDLEQTKGFEFDAMLIVNCSRGQFPDPYAPAEEQHRDLARLYVAMTRARRDLVLSYSVVASDFIGEEPSGFLAAEWSQYHQKTPARLDVSSPARLEAIRDTTVRVEWQSMTGPQFLRTPSARGLSPELIDRIRRLVDGVGLLQRNSPLKFRTMGQAAGAWQSKPTSRSLWGPEVGRQFSELILSLKDRES